MDILNNSTAPFNGSDVTKSNVATPAAKAAPKAKAKAKSAAKASPKAVAKAAKRVSRIAPLQIKVLALMAKGAIMVAATAKRLGCTEREVRLSIDRARANGVRITRTAKNQFALDTVRKAKAQGAPSIKA